MEFLIRYRVTIVSKIVLYNLKCSRIHFNMIACFCIYIYCTSLLLGHTVSLFEKKSCHKQIILRQISLYHYSIKCCDISQKQ